MYVQARYRATAEELWAWHLEGEKAFPATPEYGARPEPKEVFVEVGGRWGRHQRSDPTWLLAVEPVGERWRLYHLHTMPVREQVARGGAANLTAWPATSRRRGGRGRSGRIGGKRAPSQLPVGACQRGTGGVFSDMGYACGCAPTAAELRRRDDTGSDTRDAKY